MQCVCHVAKAKVLSSLLLFRVLLSLVFRDMSITVITSQGMDSKTLGFYLDSFANAKVEIDHSYDPLMVPFSSMAGKEIIFEGSTDSPRFLIFGTADSYHYFSNRETNYLVADQ